MFLHRQLYFYKFYFRFTEYFKLCVIKWNETEEILTLKNTPKLRKLSHILLLSNILYMIRATYLYFKLFNMNHEESSFVLDMSLHTVALSSTWCALLCRSMYTWRAKNLIEIYNAELKLEKTVFRGEFPQLK